MNRTLSTTPFAVLSLSAALALSGCSAPKTSPVMSPGEDCILCHSPGGLASDKVWSAAGTVFKDPKSNANEGVQGAVLTLKDNNGKVVSLATNKVGNFYTAEKLVPPLQVAIDYNGYHDDMTFHPTPTNIYGADTGSRGLGCNGCHGAPGSRIRGPGRIAIPGPPPDFDVNLSPDRVHLNDGDTTTVAIQTTSADGGTRSIALAVKGLPTGVTGTLNVSSVNAGGTATLTLTASAIAPNATAKVAVAGTDTSGEVDGVVTVTVGTGASDGGTSTPGGNGSADGGSSASTAGPFTNGDFEQGSLAGWSTDGTASISTHARTGKYALMVGSPNAAGDSSVSQTFKVPAGPSTLTLWEQVQCADWLDGDVAAGQLFDAQGNLLTTVFKDTCTWLDTWWLTALDVTPYASQTVTLVLTHQNAYGVQPAYTLFDDVAVTPRAQ